MNLNVFSRQLNTKTENTPLSNWITCLSISLFFFYEFLQVNMFNSLAPYLIHTFYPATYKIGLVSASYFYGSILFILPSGYILDRFNNKKIILIMMGISIFGTFLFSQSQSLLIAGIARFISGAAGGSICFGSSIRLISRRFPAHQIASIVGIVVTIGMLGGLVAQFPFASLIQLIGWRISTITIGILGIVILGIISIFASELPDNTISSATIHQNYLINIRYVIRNSQNWFCSFVTCLISGPTFILGALWGNLYLIQIQKTTLKQASLIISMLYIGVIFGAPIIGWFSDRLGLRRILIIIGILILLLLAMIFIFISHLAFHTLLLLFFLMGFFTGIKSINHSIIVQSNNVSVSGSALALATLIIVSGGAIFQSLFSFLLHLQWSSLVIFQRNQTYSGVNALIAINILPIAILCGLFCSFFIKEPFLNIKHMP